MPLMFRSFCLFAVFAFSTLILNWQLFAQDPISIEIDARDLPRKLLTAELSIPIKASKKPQDIALWYPKWVPGSHGPGGPIENVAGLTFTDQDNNSLKWSRTPGEVYRVIVKATPQTKVIRANIRYITNQPSTNSFGHDTFGSRMVGIISPNTVLLYPESSDADKALISTTLRLPKDWKAASAIPQTGHNEVSYTYTYDAVSLRNFVDSPIMCGLNYRRYDFDFTGETTKVSPHSLHVFSESPTAVNLDDSIVNPLKNMIVQTAKLTGSQPFDRFDILLAATDLLPPNGLEHSRSTLNVLPPRDLSSMGALKGWSRLLIPHEYLHTWCGKYRQPAEMATRNFQTPQGTDLLWVYEGLTQYLGEVIEARSGFMNVNEFRDRVGVELRNAAHQQNRQWRPLVDTAAASHILRDGSDTWPKLRGSQDYYMEGMLFWLEADAILRHETGGKKTLDDFCHKFFEAAEPTATFRYSPPKPFTRKEIVSTLNDLTKYDWDGLIKRRVESVRIGYDPQVADLLGYEFVAKSERPRIPPNTFRYSGGIDHLDTLGMTLSGDGSVIDVKLGSLADRAKFGPGTKIVGVNDHRWSRSVLDEAIENSADNPFINLLIEDGELLKLVQIQYDGGPKYLSFVRTDGKDDLLEKILAPR
jgi:predicted metalloprotease with PDZ domain